MSESDVKRVAAYCRVSTLQEEQEDSYELQRKYYEDLIRNQTGMVLVDVYGDHGKSGANADLRPDFQRMIRDCEAGKIDLVMTKSISRFSRSLGDCVQYVRQLKVLGISVYFERECMSSTDNNGELVLSLLASVAQEELNSISQSIRWAHEKRAKAGDPIRGVLYGYRKTARDKKGKQKWVICEPEARRVRLAFSLASEGTPYTEILKRLNALERKESTGKNWIHATLRGMLLNEAYIGDILTNKTYKPDYRSKASKLNRGEKPQFYLEGHHEPIVGRDTFAAVTQMIHAGALRSKRRRRKAA